MVNRRKYKIKEIMGWSSHSISPSLILTWASHVLLSFLHHNFKETPQRKQFIFIIKDNSTIPTSLFHTLTFPDLLLLHTIHFVFWDLRFTLFCSLINLLIFASGHVFFHQIQSLRFFFLLIQGLDTEFLSIWK